MIFKKKIFTFISAIVGTTIVVSLPFINNNKTHTNNIVNSSQNAWGGSGGSSTEEQKMELEFKTKDELEKDLKDFTPKKPNEFSNNDIKLFLKAKANSTLGSNWYVQIEKLTNEDIVNGRIKFKVFQNRRKADGSYYEKAEPIKNSNNEIWDTSSSTDLSKYILSSKYKFSWASDEDLKSFFETTTVSADTLTKEIVIDNLISKDSILPSKDKINVTFTDVGNSTRQNLNRSSKINNGIKKVTISFKDTTDSNWEGNKQPEAEKLTNIFRGFKVGDSYNDMLMEQNNEFNLNSATIEDEKLFIGLLNKGDNISNLTPSQFVSVIEENLDNPTTFFDMITKGKGIGDKPLAQIKYMGLLTTDSDFKNTTGLIDDYEIKKIRTIPNDLDGSLQLIYTYEAVDIFTNKKITKEFKQFFPASSFKTTPDANKILDFSWKAEESLLPVGSSFNLVNLYKQNLNEKEYLKELTNEFFIGSKDSYRQDREVSIDYGSGGSGTNSGNGWEPLVTGDKKIKITLTFNSWNGATYKDSDGKIKNGFKAEKIFDLKSYKVGENTNPISIKWKSQKEFIDNNASFTYELPSNIVRRIEKNQSETGSNVIRKNVFYTITNDQALTTNEVFIPDDINGTIRSIIEVYQGSGDKRSLMGVFSNIFTGMKKDDTASSIVEFSWIPDVDIDSSLLSMPIDEVTVEKVVELYLSKIPLFRNKTLDEKNVKLEKLPDSNGNEYLKVNVTIPLFDQDKNNVSVENRTFTTKITGFSKVGSESSSKIEPLSDLTALVSIPIAATSTCVFLVILNSMILRRSKVRKFKNKK